MRVAGWMSVCGDVGQGLPGREVRLETLGVGPVVGEAVASTYAAVKPALVRF